GDVPAISASHAFTRACASSAARSCGAATMRRASARSPCPAAAGVWAEDSIGRSLLRRRTFRLPRVAGDARRRNRPARSSQNEAWPAHLGKPPDRITEVGARRSLVPPAVAATDRLLCFARAQLERSRARRPIRRTLVISRRHILTGSAASLLSPL